MHTHLMAQIVSRYANAKPNDSIADLLRTSELTLTEAALSYQYLASWLPFWDSIHRGICRIEIKHYEGGDRNCMVNVVSTRDQERSIRFIIANEIGTAWPNGIWQGDHLVKISLNQMNIQSFMMATGYRIRGLESQSIKVCAELESGTIKLHTKLGICRNHPPDARDCGQTRTVTKAGPTEQKWLTAIAEAIDDMAQERFLSTVKDKLLQGQPMPPYGGWCRKLYAEARDILNAHCIGSDSSLTKGPPWPNMEFIWVKAPRREYQNLETQDFVTAEWAPATADQMQHDYPPPAHTVKRKTYYDAYGRPKSHTYEFGWMLPQYLNRIFPTKP